MFMICMRLPLSSQRKKHGAIGGYKHDLVEHVRSEAAFVACRWINVDSVNAAAKVAEQDPSVPGIQTIGAAGCICVG